MQSYIHERPPKKWTKDWQKEEHFQNVHHHHHSVFQIISDSEQWALNTPYCYHVVCVPFVQGHFDLQLMLKSEVSAYKTYHARGCIQKFLIERNSAKIGIFICTDFLRWHLWPNQNLHAIILDRWPTLNRMNWNEMKSAVTQNGRKNLTPDNYLGNLLKGHTEN